MKTIAICVLYQTESSFFDKVVLILNQVSKLIIIDNGCSMEFRASLENLTKNNSQQIQYIQEETNIGLAKAQNHGISIAKADNPDFIVFFDDDSTPSVDMVPILERYLNQNPDVGIAAPDVLHVSGSLQKYWVKEKFFWRRRSFRNGESVLKEVNTVISSGSLMPFEMIKKLGGMRDDYFIDYLDIEYCLRVRAAGFKVSVLKDAKLIHSLGDKKKIQVFGMHLAPTNHSPLRKYYMTRNRILTWRTYAFKFPAWWFIDICNFAYDTMRTLLFEEDRIKKLFAIGKGFALAITYKTSSLDNQV